MVDVPAKREALVGPPEKCPLPSELMTPSQKAKDQIDEMITEFGVDAETAGPASELRARERVTVKRGKGDISQPIEGARSNVDGATGEIVGQSYIGGSESAHAGKVCRAVRFPSGEVVCTAEENLVREGSTSFGSRRAFRRGWDRIFNRKKKGSRP